MTRVLATDCYQLGFPRKDGAVRVRAGRAVGTPILDRAVVSVDLGNGWVPTLRIECMWEVA